MHTWGEAAAKAAICHGCRYREASGPRECGQSRRVRHTGGHATAAAAVIQPHHHQLLLLLRRQHACHVRLQKRQIDFVSGLHPYAASSKVSNMTIQQVSCS